jgi:spore coat-associated protein N
MSRYQNLVRRKWRFRLAVGLPIVVLLILASAVLSSGAVFTSSSANPANIFSAGNLRHTNSKDGAAVLTASKMKPGDTTQGTVTITNDGDVAGTFSLSTSNLSDTAGANGGKLSDVLKVKIVDQTSNTTIYDGAIKSLPSGTAAGAFAAGAAHTYQFTVTFPEGGTPGSATTGDNAYKTSSMSIQFDWTEVQ